MSRYGLLAPAFPDWQWVSSLSDSRSDYWVDRDGELYWTGGLELTSNPQHALSFASECDAKSFILGLVDPVSRWAENSLAIEQIPLSSPCRCPECDADRDDDEIEALDLIARNRSARVHELTAIGA